MNPIEPVDSDVVRTKSGTYSIKNGRVRGPLPEWLNPQGTKERKAARRKQRRAAKLTRRRNRK